MPELKVVTPRESHLNVILYSFSRNLSCTWMKMPLLVLTYILKSKFSIMSTHCANDLDYGLYWRNKIIHACFCIIEFIKTVQKYMQIRCTPPLLLRIVNFNKSLTFI